MLKRSFLIGLSVTLLDSLLLSILLHMDVLGPFGEIQNRTYQIGGTILFLGIYLFLFFGVFYGLRQFKVKNEGKMTYKEALINGGTISFFTAFTSILATIILYEFVYPDYAVLMGEKVRVAMTEKGLEEKLISEKVTEIIDYHQTFVQAKFSTIGNFITGLFYTLILGVFMKK